MRAELNGGCTQCGSIGEAGIPPPYKFHGKVEGCFLAFPAHRHHETSKAKKISK